jgi:hypothetical protein
MRECISEPMNPDPLLIIRNNFPFTLSLFSFLVIINFENTKTFHKPKHYNHTFYCLPLHCIGVKTERIRTDSSEAVFVTIFFSDSKSEQIVCGYEYGIGVYR